MKVIIAGGRNFSNYEKLYQICDKILINRPVTEIVSGTARGADKLGERYGNDKGYNIKKFPADWNKYGKSAGYRRNEQMAVYADILIAFWDGKSRGTKHMIDLANSYNLEVNVIYF